ncbi:kinase-like domain-containing protein [Crucibulum laeve]|uniref:Kinase-like domain-containing protein n=1 Tax=Crucibulum laeve TaxID=68775 RepID=A0A5C3M025_9AGAR|nr:kinase-like domain-containing protein [Crucibulum laeve]
MSIAIPQHFPQFLWKFWLSKNATHQEFRQPRIHIYDVYDNELIQTSEIPATSRLVFQDIDDGSLDLETRNVLSKADRAFYQLEREAEEALTDLLQRTQWTGDTSKKSLPFDRKAVEVLRKYFVFLRFRNSAGYRDAIHSVYKSAEEHPQDGNIFTVYRPIMAAVRRRYILRGFIAFLQHSSTDEASVRQRPERHLPENISLDTFQDAMEMYCWRLCEAEVCIGIATEEQEFMLADCCFGTLDEGFDEDPECCDLFFPVFPTLALYILGTAGEHYSSTATYRQTSRSTVWLDVGLESASDVHLRNAMVLQTYPHHLYFANLRTVALSIASYDEFRWIQEHQDYSRLKQRCRQKFLQETVTKTLVVKGSLQLTDLTDEVERVGGAAVAHGSFSDVWKGIWNDPVERRPRVVALKFLRQIMVQNVREKFLKRLTAEVVAWHRLCHRNVSQLYGLIQSPNSIGMVSPWCDNGTICQYVKRNPTVNRLKLLIQVASGISYLHTFKPTVVHGDLKGGNILIDEHGHAIITDFGLSQVMEDMSEDVNIGTSFFAGSTRWMAPELVQALVEDDGHVPPITTHSDVYAFGSVCLEVATGQLPYPHRTNDHAVTVDILRGVKPSRGSCCDIQLKDAESFWTMLDRCWNFAYALRPPMPEVLALLENMDTKR